MQRAIINGSNNIPSHIGEFKSKTGVFGMDVKEIHYSV